MEAEEFYKLYPQYPPKATEDSVYDKFAGELADINARQSMGEEITAEDFADRIGAKVLSEKTSRKGENVFLELQREDLVFYMFRNGRHGQYEFSKTPSKYVDTYYKRPLTKKEKHAAELKQIEEYLDKTVSIPLAIVSAYSEKTPISNVDTAARLGARILNAAPYNKDGMQLKLEKDGYVFFIAKDRATDPWFFDADEEPYIVKDSENTEPVLCTAV